MSISSNTKAGTTHYLLKGHRLAIARLGTSLVFCALVGAAGSLGFNLFADTTNVIFSDNFETGTMAKWTTTATSPLDPSTVTNAVPPSPAGQWSAYMDTSIDRMHHNIIADNGGSELSNHFVFTSYIYDTGTNAGTVGATRVFNEIRGYSAGAGLPNGGIAAIGTLDALLAAGKFNSTTLTGEVFTATKYQGRVAFGPAVAATTGWFNLNGPGSPNRSIGWHRFDIEVLPPGDTVKFYVDGILSRTFSGAAIDSYDTVILGPGLGSQLGDAWIDGVSVAALSPSPPEVRFSSNNLPPPDGVYVTPEQFHVAFSNGIIISNISHRRFTQSHPPPPLGDTLVHNFGSAVEFDQFVAGSPAAVTRSVASASCSVRVTHSSDAGGTQTYDTEMLQLNMSGGGLPAGTMLRESPTKQSLGQTTIRPVQGGYMISSFFDIFTEISLDGGATWIPALRAARVEVHVDPTSIPSIVAPSNLIPPRNDLYISPAQFHALYANGIIIKDVRHSFFTQSLAPPPPGVNQTHQFGSQVDYQMSTDGGQTFHPGRAPASTVVGIRHRATDGGVQTYDTEMLSLNLQGGDLPTGAMLRESPTKRSLGGTAVTPNSDGTSRIGSFFDIFTEISLDGGVNWSPAQEPVRVVLVCETPEVPKPSPNLPPPDGQYVSPAQYHAAYAAGIIIRNVSHNRFTQSQPPPPVGGSQTHTFASQVQLEISMNGGNTFSPASAPATVMAMVTSSGFDSGPTRFFDTEMLALNISGGTLPAGVMVRESPSKASLGRTSIRMVSGPGGTIWDYISSFFDIFTEVSLNGGQTWMPATTGPIHMGLVDAQVPIAMQCPANMTVNASASGSAVVNYVTTASGGCNPPTIVCNPSSGSTFPVGTNTVTCVGSDSCGQSATCAFTVTVRRTTKPVFFPTTVLPPPTGVYISPALYHQLYANGIIIRDIKHRRFTQGQPPPPSGQVQTHQFGSVVELEHSMDGGKTFQKVSAPANCTVRVSSVSSTGIIAGASIGTQTFDTEMLSLDIAGGSLPAGVMLRESPTRASTGQTTVRQVGGGYMIDSFFDVFTEISLNGGATWSPAQQAAHVELRSDVALVTPIPASTRLLPPPNDVYVSPAQFHILAAQGIVIRDVRHSFFTQSMLPPAPGTKQVHQFDSQVDMMLSQDGGQTFRPIRAPAAVAVEVEAVGSAASGLYDTEMLALDIRGGDLPPGVMIRESPTLPSRGQVSMTGDPDFDLLRIGSFFDIFVETSLDGGQNWTPAQAPARIELICDAPAQPFPSPNLPPLEGQYISPQKFHALYAQGIIISNVSHRRFTQSTPPPPPGGTQIHTFNSDINMMISMNGGQTWSQVQAPAAVSVRVTSSVDVGGTRFFDTEMLALNIQGGGLPAGVMVRESPSKASLGRTSIRMVNDPATGIWDYISSFFDIFTEVSLNGGQTWLPALSQPVHMVLMPPCAVVITCPADITAYTFTAAGKAVTFAATAGDLCTGPVVATCTPASGSTFPVGTTTVNCTASSPNGTASCSFKVTVIRRVLTPRWFPRALLPPPEGEYISPQRWHQLYANGIIISNVSHRRFLQSFPPPPAGTSETHSFGSEVAGEISMDGGHTFVPLVGMGNADVTVKVTHTGTVGGTQTYDTEMLSLTLMTTNGLKLRESPSKASTGQTRLTPNPGGGFVIDSFFDVFTEISLDGGATWSPALDSVPVELHTDARAVAPITAPTRLLPPPVDLYVSPQQYHLLLAQGIQIRNVRHKLFTQSLPPPEPGIKATHEFGSQVDLELSQDGGATFRPMRAPATVAVSLEHRSTSADGTQVYDTEMLQLDIRGGDLPTGIMIRESPTLASQGGTALTATPDGQSRIGSFFDIFTEVSTDGGQNWTPAPAPAHVELICDAPPIPLPNPNLPPLDGQYISPQRWHALYAQGIIISNVSHQRFTQTIPPPAAGVTNTHSFGSQVDCDLSLNNGQTWQHTSLPAQVTVRLRQSQSSGDTRFYETEMLALNIQGGALPAAAMIRESPSKASLGRTSIRMVNDPATGIWDYISSFFDVFTELSTDGGQTWQPSSTGPGGVHLVPVAPTNCVTITCSSNIVVSTCDPNGTVVNYTVVASNNCGGTFNVTCSRPSGSVFPVGVTTVICAAIVVNSAGAPIGTASCNFTVTVNRDVKPPTPVCPNNITVRTCADGEIVSFTATATDDLDPAPVVSCVPPSGSVFPAGTTTVTCIARDACGNRTNCTFTVTVIPETLPKLTVKILPTTPALIQLCWSTPCPGYRLQCARGLEPPILWETVTNAVVSTGGTNCVTLPLQPKLRLYRLIRYSPIEVYSPTNTLPPAGSYNSPSGEMTVFPVPGVAGGIIARWFIHRVPPPVPPVLPVPLPCLTCPDITLSFATTIDLQYSTDGGQTFLNGSAAVADTRVRIHPTADSGPVRSFDTEMLALNFSGGTFPAGVMIRESPTLASTGKHVVRAIEGGYRIGSFFDVFLEVSLDGGQNWFPSLTPIHVDYNGPVADSAYSKDTFPPNGTYVNPPTVPSQYGNGLIARGFRHIVQPPCPPFCVPPPCLICPPGFYDIPTQLTFEVSSDGGHTFTGVSIPVQTRLTARHSEDTVDTRFFDVELLALNPMNVPPGTQVMLRESPTRASTGKTSVRTVPAPVGGFRISSFFDVFTEVSLDGGQTWSSVVNPTHLELQNTSVSP